MIVAFSAAFPSSTSSARPGPLTLAALRAAPSDIHAALEFAVRTGGEATVPGGGRSRDLWQGLSTLAAHDVAVARAVEPHWDAVAIHLEAGLPRPDGAWGVFAAEGGAMPVRAMPVRGGWSLSGTKPWCSLAETLDHALITATTPADERGLFAIDLRDPAVAIETGSWKARGLTEVPSGPIRLNGVSGQPIGPPGWYLRRAGFEWGGIGVAACWYGGAVGIGRAVHSAARAKPNPFLLAHLGAIDDVLQSARRALDEAADLVDDETTDGRVLAKRVRATVARAVEETIARAGHALGPAPLALDEAYAKRVADLQLYVRQHHAERDLESLGGALADGPVPW